MWDVMKEEIEVFKVWVLDLIVEKLVVEEE